MDKTMFLRSGKWRWAVDGHETGEQYLELRDPGQPVNRMSVRLPYDWRQLDDAGLAELARGPEVRLWLDEAGVIWRVTAVGPGTYYPFPLERRYLIFDSRQCWAGMVDFDHAQGLGDLTDAELRGLRDRMADIGGRRRRYRGPATAEAL